MGKPLIDDGSGGISEAKSTGGDGMDPLTIGLFAGGSLLSGIFNLWGASTTAKSTEKMHQEDLKLAREQFDWGKKIDTFDMTMKAGDAKLQAMNNLLKTNIGLQDRFRSMFAPQGN